MFIKHFISGKICLTYSKDSKFFNDANKKVFGKMKDEYGGAAIDQFIGLKDVLNKKNKW